MLNGDFIGLNPRSQQCFVSLRRSMLGILRSLIVVIGRICVVEQRGVVEKVTKVMTGLLRVMPISCGKS